MPTADRVQRVALALTRLAGADPQADRVCLLLAPPLIRFVDRLDAYPEFVTFLEASAPAPSEGGPD